MTLFAGPFDTANMTQANWTEANHAKWSDGVIKGQRNEFAVTTTSGLGLSVNTGNAVLDGEDFYSDAATALTLTAADPTNPRIDLIILRVDEAAHTGTVTFKTGTPAPSPVAPTVTQTRGGTYEIALATARVNAASATINVLTDVRTFANAAIGPNGIAASQIASVSAPQVTSGLLGTGVQLPGGANLPGAKLGKSVDGDILIATASTILNAPGVGGQVSFQSNGGTIGAFAADGSLKLNLGATFWYGIARFSGTGTGTFSHGYGTTPSGVQLTANMAGTQTMGYDTLGSTTVHVNTGASGAWEGWAIKTA